MRSVRMLANNRLRPTRPWNRSSPEWLNLPLLGREPDAPEVFPRVGGFDADVPAAVRSSLSDPSHAENFLFFRETVRYGQSAAHLQKRVHAQQCAEPADHDSFGAFVHLGVIFSKARTWIDMLMSTRSPRRSRTS